MSQSAPTLSAQSAISTLIRTFNLALSSTLPFLSNHDARLSIFHRLIPSFCSLHFIGFVFAALRSSSFRVFGSNFATSLLLPGRSSPSGSFWFWFWFLVLFFGSLLLFLLRCCLFTSKYVSAERVYDFYLMNYSAAM